MVYDSGLIVGRFQTFHKGHQSLVDAGLQLCDRVLILIGSAQESGTERNPYPICERESPRIHSWDESERG